jgi:hypothetical protein
VACKAEFNVPLGAFRAAVYDEVVCPGCATIARATRKMRFRRVSKSARSIPKAVKSSPHLTAKPSDTVTAPLTNARMA